jgi:hypothetical protein
MSKKRRKSKAGPGKPQQLRFASSGTAKQASIPEGEPPDHRSTVRQVERAIDKASEVTQKLSDAWKSGGPAEKQSAIEDMQAARENMDSILSAAGLPSTEARLRERLDNKQRHGSRWGSQGILTPRAALERQESMNLLYASFRPSIIERAISKEYTKKDLGNLLDYCFSTAWHSKVVLWKESIWAAAINNGTAFVDKPATMFHTVTPQYWFSETRRMHETEFMPDLVWQSLGMPERCTCTGMYLTQLWRNPPMPGIAKLDFRKSLADGSFDVPDKAFVGFYILEVPGDPLPYLRMLPIQWLDHGIVPWNVIPAAALSFLSLPFVEEPSLLSDAFPRQQRRAMQRAGKKIPEITTQVFRRRVCHDSAPQRAPQSPEAGQGPGGSASNEGKEEHQEWGCHWLVGANEFGFWRSQWLPSLGPARLPSGESNPESHRAVWIDPYVKGDLSKPFKPPTPKVSKASR